MFLPSKHREKIKDKKIYYLKGAILDLLDKIKIDLFSKYKTYFAESIPMDFIKIGRSLNPEERILTLSTDLFSLFKYKRDFKLLGYLPFDIELQLKHLLEDYTRRYGEYYKRDFFMECVISCIFEKFCDYIIIS